jgi:ABC-type transporter lipoprotein component MlaA
MSCTQAGSLGGIDVQPNLGLTSAHWGVVSSFFLPLPPLGALSIAVTHVLSQCVSMAPGFRI